MKSYPSKEVALSLLQKPSVRTAVCRMIQPMEHVTKDLYYYCDIPSEESMITKVMIHYNYLLTKY